MLKIESTGKVIHQKPTATPIPSAEDAMRALAILGGTICVRGTASEKVAFVEVERYLKARMKREAEASLPVLALHRQIEKYQQSQGML